MSGATTITDAAVTEGLPDASRSPEGAEGGSAPSVVTCLPGSKLPAGDTNTTIQVGGTSRSYILHVPSGVTGQAPVPLVLDFHPILSTGSYEETNSGYKALADQEGFVVAFPNGIDNAWNVGPCCTTSRTVDDLGFAKGIVTEIEKGGCIDPKRVYAVGYSMGGGLSHYLACNGADVFASVAPAAFDLLQDSEEPCHPSRPITVMSFRGTADPIVPYDGGASMPPNGLNVTIHFLGAQGTFQKWSQLDGCTGTPGAPDSNGCSTYSQCKDGVEVTLCTTQGGGHVTGNPQLGWAMLKKHPMP
jgi:polyhydroxybutyrate depolymerase